MRFTKYEAIRFVALKSVKVCGILIFTQVDKRDFKCYYKVFVNDVPIIGKEEDESPNEHFKLLKWA